MSSNLRPRVLCVDDDEDMRVMLSMLLGIESIDAETVGTADQALSLVQAKRFDLYLMDAWLPQIDGFELCRRLRAIDRQTPVLFFSGAAFEADRKRAIESGAAAYIIKPDLDSLLGNIRQFVFPAESARPKVVRFRRKVNSFAPFTFDPLAA